MFDYLNSSDIKVLQKHSDTQLKKDLENPKIKYFSSLFGEFKKIKTVKCLDSNAELNQKGECTATTYKVEAKFENGDVDFILKLNKVNNAWHVAKIKTHPRITLDMDDKSFKEILQHLTK